MILGAQFLGGALLSQQDSDAPGRDHRAAAANGHDAVRIDLPRHRDTLKHRGYGRTRLSAGEHPSHPVSQSSFHSDNQVGFLGNGLPADHQNPLGLEAVNLAGQTVDSVRSGVDADGIANKAEGIKCVGGHFLFSPGGAWAPGRGLQAPMLPSESCFGNRG